MSPTRIHRTTLFLGAAVLVMMTWFSGVAEGQTLPLGTVQRLPVITLDLRAGSTEKQSKRVTYTPPPGWYIRCHYVIFTQRHGNTSYLVLQRLACCSSTII